MAEEQSNENAEETTDAAADPVAEGSEATPPEAPAASEPARAASEPAEVLPPKERRQRARAARAATASPRRALTPEERHAERLVERRQKARARRVERQRSRAKGKSTPSGEPTPPREREPGRQKTRQGIVVSDRADKTITVRIDIARRHRRYEKIVRTSNTLHAHDEENDAHIGDTVIVRESRPLSRTKRWRLIQVVERAQ
jgi:small subunit ribosomal protein S17